MAPAAHVLWTRHMKFNPKNPKWFNRDRFVLSNGHAYVFPPFHPQVSFLDVAFSCALQYIMLHLSGYKVSMDDLKGFRQVDSITPGHPELGVTDGIEVTTGPLGQGQCACPALCYRLVGPTGISNAVGMAMGQAHMGAVFNKEGFPLVDNYTYGELPTVLVI